MSVFLSICGENCSLMCYLFLCSVFHKTHHLVSRQVIPVIDLVQRGYRKSKFWGITQLGMFLQNKTIN